ncbi:MAG: hypothetical protein HOP28_06825 [Gemmatimonadales bacterium]|nr:hypothetical protein [Gemmatimonadales bacterium]
MPPFLALLVLLIAQAGQVPDPLPSSWWLSRLPEGLMKRRFILDCTGCHLFDAARAFKDAAPRTADRWREDILRMFSYAGPRSSFPVISGEIDPDSASQWLGEQLRSLSSVGAGPPALPNRGRAEVREYTLPGATDLPHDVAVASDGKVLITGMFSHVIHSLDPETGAMTQTAIPIDRANPRAMELDEDGNWWVLLGGPNSLARRDARTGAWTVYPVGMYGHSLAVGGGKVWVNGHFTRDPELVSALDIASGKVSPIESPPRHPTLATAAHGGGPVPYELRVAPDGRVWVGELQGNRLLAFDPARRTWEAFTMPAPLSGPRRFDIDRTGILWIPAYSDNALYRLDPGTGRFDRYELPIADAVPYVARVDDRSGRVWVGTAAADAVFALDIASRRYASYPLPSRGALVRHLAIDPKTRDVWLAYGASPGRLSARVARLRPQ